MSVNRNLSQVQPGSAAKPVSAHGVSAAAKERAQRHYARAQEQIKMKNLNVAVQELRDAIKADPNNGDYHALLGKVHLDKGLTGMAAINLRQALKLEPQNALALNCMQKLNTQNPANQPAQPGFGERLRNLLTKKL